MYCIKCGNKLDGNNRFCPNCGAATTNNNETNYFASPEKPYNDSNEQIAKLEKKTKDLGIVSLILSFFMSIVSIPIAIIGIKNGIKLKNMSGKNNTGLTLSIIALVLSVFFIAVSIPAIKSIYRTIGNIANSSLITDDYDDSNSYETNSTNYHDSVKQYFTGTWNCGSPSNPDNYTFVVTLNANNRYYAGQYGDLENNHGSGNYEFSYNNKIMSTTDSYYIFWFYLEFTTTDEFIYNGEKQDDQYNAKFEVGRLVGNGYTNKYITLYSTNGLNTYLCEKENS